MDFIREIKYEVWARMNAEMEECVAKSEIYTLLEIPEAQEALETRHKSYTIKIVQYRALPFLTATNP